MAEPPPDAKRQRLDDQEAAAAGALDAAEAEGDGLAPYPADLDAPEEAFAAYTNHQGDIDQVAEECSSKILAIEYEYAKKKRPLLQARGQALRQMPQFWKKVLCAHPQFRPYMTDTDLSVLDYLEEVDYDDSEDPTRTGWKIRFMFAENPYFENTEIVKEYKYPDDASPLVSTCTGIQWRPGRAPLSEEQQQQQLAGSKRAAPDNDYNFISQWLRGEPEGVYGGNDPLSEVLKEEIWPNPMAVLTAAEAAAEDEEELGEGEEVIEIDDDDELQEGEDEGEEEFEEGGEEEFEEDEGGEGEEAPEYGQEDEGEGLADEGENDDADPAEGA